MQKASLNAYLFILFFLCLEFFQHTLGWSVFLVFALCALLVDQVEQLWKRVKQLETKLSK
jgi:hypothetical protein